MSRPQVDLSSWPTKSEAAQALGVAEKTIDRMTIRGELQKTMRNRPGLPPIVVFHPGDVERARNARIAEASKSFVMPEQGHPVEAQAIAVQNGHTSTHTSDVSNSVGAALAAAWIQASAAVPVREKLFLTEAQAIDYTGIGRVRLRELVQGEKIGPHGAVVYRRSALEKL